MKRIFIIITLCLSLAIVTLLICNYDYNSYTIKSRTGCCTISVKDRTDVNGIKVKVVTYYSYDTGKHDRTYTHDGTELDETINMYQEYCYSHHN